MKNLVVVTLFVILAVAVWARPAEDDEHYTDEFDTLDIEEVLNNPRIFDNYANCLRTGKKCTPAGTKLREVFPDALKTSCKKCTASQKKQSRKVLNFLIKNKPKEFREFEDIYDPDHVYRKTYGDQLKEEGLILPPL